MGYSWRPCVQAEVWACLPVHLTGVGPSHSPLRAGLFLRWLLVGLAGGAAVVRGLGMSPATWLTPQACPDPGGQITKVKLTFWVLLSKAHPSSGPHLHQLGAGPKVCPWAGCWGSPGMDGSFSRRCPLLPREGCARCRSSPKLRSHGVLCRPTPLSTISLCQKLSPCSPPGLWQPFLAA